MDSIFRGKGYFESKTNQLEHQKITLSKFKEEIIGELNCP